MDVKCPFCGSEEVEEWNVTEDFPSDDEIWYNTQYTCTDCKRTFTVKETFLRISKEIVD